MKQTYVNKQVPAPLNTPFFTQITASLSWLQHSSYETSASHADYTILYTNNCQPLLATANYKVIETICQLLLNTALLLRTTTAHNIGTNCQPSAEYSTPPTKQVPATLTTPFSTQITASLSWLQHSSYETSASHADYTILYTNNCQPLLTTANDKVIETICQLLLDTALLLRNYSTKQDTWNIPSNS